MPFIFNEPYNDLPLLPPNNKYWETLDVYKKLAETKAALAELKGRMPVIPNPKMLINTLVLQEAKESSSIENIFTSSEKLYKAFSSPDVVMDSQTKEVLSYRNALWKAWHSLQSSGWSTALIEGIYQDIKQAADGIRPNKVYIGNRQSIIYVPPFGEDIIRQKLDNWVAFANESNGLDPLIKMAILHYQFEAIHPFSDGNGRTGRVLNVLFISYKKLLDLPVIYLSKYINENKADYYRLLRQVTENGNWTEWIIYMLDAVRVIAEETMAKINAIYDLFQNTIELVKSKLPRIYKYELVELLFFQPYCKISFLVEAGLASRNTASKYLNELEEMGILQKEQSGKEVLFLNKPLYELLSNL